MILNKQQTFKWLNKRGKSTLKMITKGNKGGRGINYGFIPRKLIQKLSTIPLVSTKRKKHLSPQITKHIERPQHMSWGVFVSTKCTIMSCQPTSGCNKKHDIVPTPTLHKQIVGDLTICLTYENEIML